MPTADELKPGGQAAERSIWQWLADWLGAVAAQYQWVAVDWRRRWLMKTRPEMTTCQRDKPVDRRVNTAAVKQRGTALWCLFAMRQLRAMLQDIFSILDSEIQTGLGRCFASQWRKWSVKGPYAYSENCLYFFCADMARFLCRSFPWYFYSSLAYVHAVQ